MIFMIYSYRIIAIKGVPRVFLNPTISTRNRASSTSTGDHNLIKIEISTVLELENFAATRLKTTLQEQGITIKTRE